MKQFEANDLPKSPPKDDLTALLRPLLSLADADLDQLPDATHDPDLLPNQELLQFRPDGTPAWWPVNRDPNGENWTLAERRRVLHRRLVEILPEGSPPTTGTPIKTLDLVHTLRHIAYALRSKASDILSLS